MRMTFLALLLALTCPLTASAQMQQDSLRNFVKQAEAQAGFHRNENMQGGGITVAQQTSVPGSDQIEQEPQFEESFGPETNVDENAAAPATPARISQLDDIMNQALAQYYVPGGSLAVAYKGKLIYAKGFGFANLRTREPVTPTTLFNLASCTKAVSTFGILKLVEAGRIQLDDTMYSVIGRPNLVRGMEADPLVAKITIRQLLHHSAGWNDDSGYLKAGREITKLAPNGLPFSEGIRVLLGTPLDYPPGTQAKYANGDWNIIKYIIECVSQETYGRFMLNRLAEIGITRMCEESPGVMLGQACRYGGYPPHILVSGQRTVPLMPSFGNWMASSVDMVRFLTAIDGTRMAGISEDSFEQMIAPLPPPMQNEPNGSHFGLGMDSVRMLPDGVTFTKNGGKPGVHCQIVHLPHAIDYCLMFNGGTNPNGDVVNPLPSTLKQIRGVLTNLKEWPQGDLFSAY